jgi:hypothetical protein
LKINRIVIVAVLMTASVWATYVLWARQALNTSANENREEQSNMTNEKVIMLIEARFRATFLGTLSA